MSKTQIETLKPPSADDPVLPDVVRRLVEVYHPLRIYLFGSAARGDAGPDSDYDIMVVVPDDTPADLQRSRRDTGLFVTLESRGTFSCPPLWTSNRSCI